MRLRDTAPIVRWAGGKRWLVPAIARLTDACGGDISRYVEPFVGGGAIYFAFEWPSAVLSDTNAELIATYRAIRRHPDAVCSALASLSVDRTTYDRIRLSHPQDDITRAARLLYLNRCGYGGIYRTNRFGMFNVPFSGDRTLDAIADLGRIRKLSNALKASTLRNDDFSITLGRVNEPTFIYCDPVYALPQRGERFHRYGSRPFSWQDQLDLAEACHELSRNGSIVAVSNASHPELDHIYRGAFVMTFKRRAPLPRALGATTAESLFVLADRGTLRRIRRKLADGV